MFKIRKNSRILRKFYNSSKFLQKFLFITSPVTAKSLNSHNTSNSWGQCPKLIDYTDAIPLNGNSRQLRTPILTLGKTLKLQAIRRLCNRAAMNVIIWILWILKLTVLKCVKIREFQEILKLVKFEFSIYASSSSSTALSSLSSAVEVCIPHDAKLNTFAMNRAETVFTVLEMSYGQLVGQWMRSDLLMTVKIKITENVIKDHNQITIVISDLDQNSKITHSDDPWSCPHLLCFPGQLSHLPYRFWR